MRNDNNIREIYSTLSPEENPYLYTLAYEGGAAFHSLPVRARFQDVREPADLRGLSQQHPRDLPALRTAGRSGQPDPQTLVRPAFQRAGHHFPAQLAHSLAGHPDQARIQRARIFRAAPHRPQQQNFPLPEAAQHVCEQKRPTTSRPPETTAVLRASGASCAKPTWTRSRSSSTCWPAICPSSALGRIC